MVRVRFHLGLGKHYQQWQIRHDDGRVEYHRPDDTTLIIRGCWLKSHRGTAQRIFDGGNKSVCAWVEAESVHVVPGKADLTGLDERAVSFNPRVAPYWRDAEGQPIDGCCYRSLMSVGRQLLVSAY